MERLKGEQATIRDNLLGESDEDNSRLNDLIVLEIERALATKRTIPLVVSDMHKVRAMIRRDVARLIGAELPIRQEHLHANVREAKVLDGGPI